MAEEILEVRIPQSRGDDVVISKDEGIRDGVTAGSLAKLRPAFGSDGSITVGSSSPISDGAAAMVVASKDAADRLGTHTDRGDRRACERRGSGLIAAAAAGGGQGDAMIIIVPPDAS
jgi:acetyl-CoA acetyltransferase